MANALRRIAAATVVAATLDLGANFILWGLWKQVSPIRICQTIATGIYGKAAFAGGWQTAFVGLVAHYLIMLGMAVVLYVALTILPILKRLWLLTAIGYGLALYGIMNYVVISLSANGKPGTWPPVWGVPLYFNLFCHIVLVALVLILMLRDKEDS